MLTRKINRFTLGKLNYTTLLALNIINFAETIMNIILHTLAHTENVVLNSRYEVLST